MIGRRVGRFHIIARLGEGGMGTVWKGEDATTGTFAAVKFLPPALARDPDARRRFLREAAATSALAHPHVAALYESGETEGEPYIAVECVDGDTVAALVARGPLPVDEAVRIAIEAGTGLAHAHARGVVHRDVTAGNVMRGADGRVRVIDFGLAWHDGASHITSSGTTVGTLHYAAPELLRGGMADERADVYGLGVVLYEMLTGRLPYTGDRAAAIVYRVSLGDAPPPGTLRDGVPTALDAATLRAIAPEPRERHASMAALVAELRAVAGDGTSAPGAPAPPARRIVVRLPRDRRVAFAPFRDVAVTGSAPAPDTDASRGLAEHLAMLLAREPGLQVIPPGALGPDPGDAVAAAARQGANLLVDGVVRRAAGRVRVSFGLHDVAERTLLAGDSIDGDENDWFTLEDTLLERIARALEVPAVARRPGRLERPAAHADYLRAVGLLQRMDDEASVDRALAILDALRRSEGASAEIESQAARACVAKFVLTRSTEWVHHAEAACREALRLDPYAPEVLVVLARVQIRTGRTREAVPVLEQALAMRGQDVDAWQLLSSAYEQLGDAERAEAACRRAIELRPDFWSTRNRYGTLLYERGRFDDAIREWDRVVELTPDNANGIHNGASARFAIGRLDEAANGYRRSLALKPSATAWTGLGSVQFFSGEFAASLDSFREAVRLRPNDPMMWGNLGDALRWVPGCATESSEHFGRAVALVREHLAVKADDADAWANLALWQAKLGHATEARAAMARALALAPDRLHVRTVAVSVAWLAGDCDEARQRFGDLWCRGWSRTELAHDPELAELRKETDRGRIDV